MSRTVAIPVLFCTNCDRWLHVRVPLMLSGGKWVCTREGCGYSKDALFHGRNMAAGLVVSSVSVGTTLFTVIEPIVRTIPLGELVAPFVLAGYLFMSLRFMLGVVKPYPKTLTFIGGH